MQETAERFVEPATKSCATDEMNYSLVATNNDSPFHLSFGVPSWTVEGSRRFYS
jgi:hypothetical protein